MFARESVAGQFPCIQGRARDILSLPVVDAVCLDYWSPIVCRDVVSSLLNLTCAGLNFLFMGGSVCAVPSSPYNLQRGVIRRLTIKLDGVFHEISLIFIAIR